MTTRSRLLLLLRKHPGSTVTELAEGLELTGMAVRRHLEALTTEGLVERSGCDNTGAHTRGRPPRGWSLSATGLELFPRRYEALALDILGSLAEGDDAEEAVSVVLGRCTDKLAGEYREAIGDNDSLHDRAAALTRLRDDAGYMAELNDEGDGSLTLTENNCAVHRVAERWPGVCGMELSLIRQVLGPDVEVTRESHTMSGDAVCRYRIRPL